MSLQWLLLLRHGEAHHSSPDELRQLTHEGRREVEKTISKASKSIPRLDHIFHSGLVRAMQTAEIAVQKLDFSLPPQFLPGITPWGDPKNFCEFLGSEESRSIMVVTHNPFVEDLVEYLTGQSVRVKTGTLVCLQVDFLERGCCSLEWLQN